jgi:hypothetical protein
MPWSGQPAAPGALRAELTWQAHPGTAGAIASALAGWNRLRFEVTEDSSPGCDGVRHCYTPNLGLFTAVTGANGDIMVTENRLRSVMLLAERGGAPASLEDELGKLLGTAWDNELEPFRRAADGAPVRWLSAMLAQGGRCWPGGDCVPQGGLYPPGGTTPLEPPGRPAALTTVVSRRRGAVGPRGRHDGPRGRRDHQLVGTGMPSL